MLCTDKSYLILSQRVQGVLLGCALQVPAPGERFRQVLSHPPISLLTEGQCSSVSLQCSPQKCSGLFRTERVPRGDSPRPLPCACPEVTSIPAASSSWAAPANPGRAPPPVALSASPPSCGASLPSCDVSKFCIRSASGELPASPALLPSALRFLKQ